MLLKSKIIWDLGFGIWHIRLNLEFGIWHLVIWDLDFKI
jgi:hypothetical protein